MAHNEFFVNPPVLPSDPQDATIQLYNRVNTLERVLAEFIASVSDERHVVPPRPREGMFAFADGTNWNPGAGKGLYHYQGVAWVKL